MHKVRQGYTLFETIVVVAILAIVGAIAVPSIGLVMGNTPIKAAADQVKSRWAEARAKAMEQGKPYRFAVTGDNKYRVAPDDDFDGQSGMDDVLPKDVSFVQGGSNNQNNNNSDNACVVFQPDGTATADFELGLNGKGCSPMTLKMNKISCMADVSR